MPIDSGVRLGPYEVLAPLGAGGMGEVYRARDTRLDRVVAIKVLPAHLSSDPALRARFAREARAVSALSHPNICTLFDVGQQGDIDFLVMEYVEGETLSSLLRRTRLEPPQVVALGGEIADALHEAHQHGIIHRDVKPQNIIVTPRGHAKVLDFGLAKAFEAVRPDEDTHSAAMHTRDGTLLGTGPYMSPEQVRGETVDPRSDAFSFGAVLYEMATGRRAFTGNTLPETLSAILTAQPEPIDRVAPQMAPEVRRIVQKCLEKDRTRRYQTLRDVATDLERLRDDRVGPTPRATAGWRVGVLLAVLGASVATGAWYWRGRGTPAARSVQSLAVLPLKPLAGDLKENYVGLGISDAIIARISQAGGLTVRPTSAVRRYATTDTDALAAAKEQLVDAVLEGSWQREGDRLRVSVNLLRQADGASLWADRFDVRAADIFAVQDQVSERLVAQLRLQLSPDGQARARQGGTTNLEAHDAFTKGQFYFGDRGFSAANRQNSDRAVELFERAVALDPGFAQGHAMLGFALAWTAVFIEDNQALIVRAKAQTDRAEQLNPGLAQVHLNRAFIVQSKYDGWRIADALREVRMAERLDSAAGEIDREAAALYAHLGFWDQWRKASDRAIAADPTNRQIRVTYVNEFFLYNSPEDGLALQKRLLDEEPDERYFLFARRLADAAPIVEKKALANDPTSVMNLATLRALQGRHAEARATTERFLAMAQKNRYYHHLTYGAVRVYALGGDAGEATRWLKETIDWGFPCYPLFASDAFLDPVRQAPEFQRVLEELRVQWERYRQELEAS